MDHIQLLPLILSAMGILATYINLSLSFSKREKERDLELKIYVDKEIGHIKNLHKTEIIHLNQKIDKLIDLVERLRDRE